MASSSASARLSLPRPALALLALLLAAARCGDTPRAGIAAAPSQPSMPTVQLERDPCGWLSRDEVERVIGPVAAAPERVKSAERLDPAADGGACLYRIAERPGEGQLAFALESEGAMAMETGIGGARDVSQAFPSRRGGLTFDFVSGLPAGIVIARRGYLGIELTNNTLSVSQEKVRALAAAILDKVPDLPPARSAADPGQPADGKDPCALLSRAEAEAVLGRLSVAPYRARESTALAHGAGPSCAYYTGRHRVLVVTPTWSDGRMLFRMSTALSGMARPVLDEKGGTGTLQGPWERAGTGADGRLYFLKGDRMLEVIYRTSAADAPGAAKLAAAAVTRL